MRRKTIRYTIDDGLAKKFNIQTKAVLPPLEKMFWAACVNNCLAMEAEIKSITRVFKEDNNEVIRNLLAEKKRELKCNIRFLTNGLSAKKRDCYEIRALNESDHVRLVRVKRNLRDASGHRLLCEASSGAGMDFGYHSFGKISCSLETTTTTTTMIETTAKAPSLGNAQH